MYVVDLSAFKSNAACVAVDTGLPKSDVLSTLPKPTCAFVTLCGLDVLVICALTVDLSALAFNKASSSAFV